MSRDEQRVNGEELKPLDTALLVIGSIPFVSCSHLFLNRPEKCHLFASHSLPVGSLVVLHQYKRGNEDGGSTACIFTKPFHGPS